MDSRTSSILLNLNLNLNTASSIESKYMSSISKINDSAKGNKKKVYKSLKSTIKECYLTGSLRYGSNLIG